MAQEIPPIESLSPSENRRRMIAGELYYASTPELAEDRRQCRAASHDYNTHSLTGESPRRRLVAIWR
ncbi:nodulation protein L [Podospora appendiculata]|uniref:Nodulation protein L n=1 Tax=Podospora appendiculata TaxID=314037 RepID=A0AAE1CE68_9PEZI|nr:nodulation protein L [Podospora appendiculata]